MTNGATTTDLQEQLESERRNNGILTARVSELERQLARFAEGAQQAGSLGTALSEREALLTEAERLIHMGSWFWNLATNEVIWSDEFYRILGHDPRVVQASTERFFASIHPEDRERVQAVAARGVATGVAERVEYRVLRADGVVRHVAMDGALLFDADGKLQRAVGAVLDVTDARNAAAELERTAERLAEAQRIGKMGSFEVDLASGQLTWSDEMYRIVDVDPSCPPSYETFLERLHDDDRERIRVLIERSLHSGLTTPSRARLVHRDGSIRHLDMMAAVGRDAQGKPRTISGTIADITDLVRLEAQFHQSQKMEAVGQLAGGLAHDYNNLLMVISGNVELLLDRYDGHELSEILSATSSAAALTNRLLAFSKREAQRPRVVKLDGDVHEARSLLQRAVGDRVVLRCDIAPGAWPVLVESGQIQQVLLNLALNARDAMPEGGTLTLSVRNVHLDPIQAEALHERAGDYVALSVSDTGIGMDETVRARAFEPFFSTKAAGHGTGLGLAMVFGAMKQCSGFVRVRSEPQAGATFTLWFPRAVQPEFPSQAPTYEAPGRSGRVLLVEDNPAVADVATRILESAGYSVRNSHDPREGLEMWRSEPADVLITDVEMPGMSGIRLRERVRAITSDLRTLFITGHSTEQIDLSADPGRCAVVMKPFRRQELLVTLANLLSYRDPGSSDS